MKNKLLLFYNCCYIPFLAHQERHTKFLGDSHQTEYIHNSLFDYDAYDAQIFTIPSAHGTSSLQRAPRSKKTSVPCLEGFGSGMTSEWENVNKAKPSFLRKMSDPDIHHGSTGLVGGINCKSFKCVFNVHEFYLRTCLRPASPIRCPRLRSKASLLPRRINRFQWTRCRPVLVPVER